MPESESQRRLVLQRHDVTGTNRCIMRVLDQSHRGIGFYGSFSDFRAQNGVLLESDERPGQRRDRPGVFHVRGSVVAGDYDERIMDNDAADLIEAAVREYNALGVAEHQKKSAERFWRMVF